MDVKKHWLYQTTSTYHYLPTNSHYNLCEHCTSSNSVCIAGLNWVSKPCRACALVTEPYNVVNLLDPMKWNEIDLKVVEARKAYGTKSMSTWCQNRQFPRVTKCCGLNKIERYNHNELYQNRVMCHQILTILETSLNNYHALKKNWTSYRLYSSTL